MDGSGSNYMQTTNLNAFSVIARTFCVSIEDVFKKRGLEISPKEFKGKDTKEIVFFNWALLNINPYATKFFGDLKQLR